MKKLVILGGGYGGMKILTRLLPNMLPEHISITLIDKMPYHALKTEFYALAAGTITDQGIRVPFPEHPHLQIKQSEVINVDLEEKKILLKNEEVVEYDDLIIGLGCEENYQDVPGAKKYTNSIQTMEKARCTYEALSNLSPGATVSIVGAGLSGVEFASELNESRPDLKIGLYDRGKHILSSFPEQLSTYVENWFDNHGVDININANITRVEKNIIFNHEEPIQSDVVIWAAGVVPNKVIQNMDVQKDRQGRVILTPYHNIPNNEHVYVVGDCASLPYAPSAQLAEGQAEQIVQVLLSRWKNEPLPEDLPPIKLKGFLGALGRKHGFGFVAARPITGRVARLLKSGVLWLYRFHNA
jgi:NADH dehydrogenase